MPTASQFVLILGDPLEVNETASPLLPSIMPEPYAKAPIVEAVIDLRVTVPDEITVHAFDQLKLELMQEFPTQGDFFVAAAQYQINESPISSVVREHTGFRFESADKRKVLIVSTQSFTFSQLAPYDSWDTFRTEARDYWDRYKAVARPTRISRLGVRYINRIDLPISNRLHAYLKLFPTVPAIPNRASLGFFMQLQVPQPDIESMLIINEGRVEAPNPETFSILLDIDLFRDGAWDIHDEESVWDFFEQLRARKNEVFEACITQKTRESIS